MKHPIRKIALLMIVLSLVLLIAPAAADMGPPDPVLPWGDLYDRHDRDTIVERIRSGGSHPNLGSVLLDHIRAGDGSALVDIDKFNQFQDLIDNLRAISRTRLSSFIS